MAAPRRKADREAALDKLSRLYLTGRSQRKCAELLGVAPSTICKDLATLQARWQASALENIDAAKARELARIDAMERAYWDAWRRSCRDKESETAEKTTGGDGERTKAGKRREGQAGNPAFLAGVQWCVEQRCKLIGLEAPKRLEMRDTTPAESLTDEQLDAIIARSVAARSGHRDSPPPSAPHGA